MKALSIYNKSFEEDREQVRDRLKEYLARHSLELTSPGLHSLPYSPYIPTTYQDPLESQQETIKRSLSLAREQKESWWDELCGTTLYAEARKAARYHLQNLASRERTQRRLRDIALTVAEKSMDETYVEKATLVRQQQNFAEERRSYQQKLQGKEQKIRDLEKYLAEKIETCPFGRPVTLRVREQLKGRAYIKDTECVLAEAINQSTKTEEEFLARSRILKESGCPLSTFHKDYNTFKFDCKYADGEGRSHLQFG